MSIKANVGNSTPVIVLTTDTVLYQLPIGIDRYHVGACNVFNTDIVNTATIQVYISPGLASAGAKLVDTVKLGALGRLISIALLARDI